MGAALARAAAKSPLTEQLLLSNRSAEKPRRLAEELGGTVLDNRGVAQKAEVLFLAVKPQMLPDVIGEIRPELDARRDRVVLVSLAAGWNLEKLGAALGDRPIVRIMPNIPVSVGAGVTLLCPNGQISAEELQTVEDLLAASGLVSELDEGHLDAAGGVTGCGPAFAAMFVEALADGAVACGLPRREALAFAAQMLKGSAQLLLETGEHPGSLKDRVCSPGGSTIQGVRLLEERAFRAAATDAVIATYEKKF
jgi:pyrroline-5-carboxylate reductase